MHRNQRYLVFLKIEGQFLSTASEIKCFRVLQSGILATREKSSFYSSWLSAQSLTRAVRVTNISQDNTC